MTSQIRFFGVAAYDILTSRGQHILIDPFLDDNPVSPVSAAEVEADLILVTHAAFDHMGDTAAIAKRTGAPVICGGEVKAYLKALGVPGPQIRATTWGIEVEVAGIKVRPIECHHWSQVTLPDGQILSGVPMGFIVYADPGVRIYHYGDTALFSDLKLVGELYRPTIGLIGVANPQAILGRVEGPGQLVTGEMSPREAALAALWLGVDVVLPNHYTEPDDPDVQTFVTILNSLSGGSIDIKVLTPGERYTCVPHAEERP